MASCVRTHPDQKPHAPSKHIYLPLIKQPAATTTGLSTHEQTIDRWTNLACGGPKVELCANVQDLTAIPDELPPPELVGHRVQDPGVQQPEDCADDHKWHRVASNLSCCVVVVGQEEDWVGPYIDGGREERGTSGSAECFGLAGA